MSYSFDIMRLQRMSAVAAKTYVFQSRKGVHQPIGKIQAWKIVREAAITNELTGKLGTHMMRKTFADRLYGRLGHDLFKTQEAPGHHNVNSTVQYLHIDQHEIDQAIRASELPSGGSTPSLRTSRVWRSSSPDTIRP